MPLESHVGVSGYYKIDVSGLNFMSDYSCIKLEDKLMNKFIDLTSEPSYSFRMNVNDKSDRFIVHFSKDNNCRSFVASNSISSDFANQIEILPTFQGNVINFNLSETTKTTISVVNLLGQTIANEVILEANTQSVNITVPENFEGMYILKIASSKGIITKKFERGKF